MPLAFVVIHMMFVPQSTATMFSVALPWMRELVPGVDNQGQHLWRCITLVWLRPWERCSSPHYLQGTCNSMPETMQGGIFLRKKEPALIFLTLLARERYWGLTLICHVTQGTLGYNYVQMRSSHWQEGPSMFMAHICKSLEPSTMALPQIRHDIRGKSTMQEYHFHQPLPWPTHQWVVVSILHWNSSAQFHAAMMGKLYFASWSGEGNNWLQPKFIFSGNHPRCMGVFLVRMKENKLRSSRKQST